MLKKIIKKILPQEFIDFVWGIITFFVIKIYSFKYKPLIIRRGTTDSIVFRSIFMIGEFKLPVQIHPKLIIDVGAYTGLSTLYFAQEYPEAKIIAVEPEDSNFEILEKHTRNLKNVSRIKAGLWNKETYLKIIDTGTGKWGFKVEEAAENDNYDIKAVTVDKLLKDSGFTHIDILKLDIEGAEKELFSDNYQSWLDKVNIIVLELHDRFIPGCSDALYSAINPEDWEEYKSGEKLILIRKKFIND